MGGRRAIGTAILAVAIALVLVVSAWAVFFQDSSETYDEDATLTVSEDTTISSSIVVSEGATLTIELSAELVLAEGVHILVYGTLVVEGDGDAAITSEDGSSSSGAVHVYSAGYCKVSGVEFSCGADSACGGAIYSAGDLRVSDCTFSGCSASNGGAVFVAGSGYAEISNCTFSGNSAVEHGGAVCVGGSYPTVLIRGCTFSQNSAEYGGALAAYDCGAAVAVADSVFTGNTAEYGGGAYVSADGYDCAVGLSGCTVSGNTAEHGDGAYVDGSACTLFTAGYALTLVDGSTIDSMGGANGISDDVDIADGELDEDESLFIAPFAESSDGSEFAGWSSYSGSDSADCSAGAAIVLTANQVLYAVWARRRPHPLIPARG